MLSSDIKMVLPIGEKITESKLLSICLHLGHLAKNRRRTISDFLKILADNLPAALQPSETCRVLFLDVRLLGWSSHY